MPYFTINNSLKYSRRQIQLAVTAGLELAASDLSATLSPLNKPFARWRHFTTATVTTTTIIFVFLSYLNQ